jgi:hypothetical protein
VCIGVQWPDYLAMFSGLLVQTLCADADKCAVDSYEPRI